jgi:hypothetical protein
VPEQHRSLNDYVDAPVGGPPMNTIDHPAGVQSQFIRQFGKSPFTDQKSFRTIDANPAEMVDLVKDNAAQNGAASFREMHDASLISGLRDQSVSFMEHGSSSPALTSFHITDLIERSIVANATEREQNKLRQIVDFYKRAVKDEKSIRSKKEIMIRNYRLYVVKDSDAEIDDKSRALMTLNKGTCIHVSNSLVKPEIYKFSTAVSNQIADVYPFLADSKAFLPRKYAKRRRSFIGRERLEPLHREDFSDVGVEQLEALAEDRMS